MCTPSNKKTAATENTTHDSNDERFLRQFFTNYCNRRSRLVKDDSEDTLLSIERFVTVCIASEQAGYRIATKKPSGVVFTPLLLGNTYFHRLNEFISRRDPNCFYCSPVELFFTACKELNLFSHRFVMPTAINAYGVTDAELFNRLIQKIREGGRMPQYRNKLAKEYSRMFGKFFKLVNYTDALFEHVRSRLILIRLDLKYHSDFAAKMKVGQAQEDLKHFFRNMSSKPSLFSDLVGYIWCLERGANGGFDHFHVVLFFSNDRLGIESHRAELIGKYWESVVTRGYGSYFSAHRSDYWKPWKPSSLGRIEYYDHQKRYGLLDLLAYLCKDEQKIREKPKKRSRSYGKGEMPTVRENSSGRPRSVEVSPKAYLTLSGSKSIGANRGSRIP